MREAQCQTKIHQDIKEPKTLPKMSLSKILQQVFLLLDFWVRYRMEMGMEVEWTVRHSQTQRILVLNILVNVRRSIYPIHMYVLQIKNQNQSSGHCSVQTGNNGPCEIKHPKEFWNLNMWTSQFYAGCKSLKNPGFPAPAETESWRPWGKARKLHTDVVETTDHRVFKHFY